jgi:hypothetical protein
MRRSLAVGLLACGVALGCKSERATAPRGGLTVEVPASSVVGLRSGTHPLGGFAGEALLRNSTATDMRVNACAPDVEREIRSGEWLTVLRRYCTLQLGLSDVEVPAMGEIAVPWAAYAPFSGADPSTIDADLAGRYRLVYRYIAEGESGNMEEARSSPFVVTD